MAYKTIEDKLNGGFNATMREYNGLPVIVFLDDKERPMMGRITFYAGHPMIKSETSEHEHSIPVLSVIKVVGMFTGETYWERPEYPMTWALARDNIGKVYEKALGDQREDYNNAPQIVAATVLALLWRENRELEARDWSRVFGVPTEINYLYDLTMDKNAVHELEAAASTRSIYYFAQMIDCALTALENLDE